MSGSFGWSDFRFKALRTQVTSAFSISMYTHVCTYERQLWFSTWALCGSLNPRPLISFTSYLVLYYCSLAKLPDLVRHVRTCTGLSLHKKLGPISFNPRPLSCSQRNAEPRCKNTNAPGLLLSYVNKCSCSYGGLPKLWSLFGSPK